MKIVCVAFACFAALRLVAKPRTFYLGELWRDDQGRHIYATIPFTLNEATQTLTIGARQGNFPGMLTNRTFRIVCVSSGHGVGVANTATADSVVAYNGTAVQIQVGP